MKLEHSVVGKIIDVPGTYDEGGNELTPPTFKEGWHVNMVEVLPSLANFRVFPENPLRVYGGVDTVFLRFDSEEQWLALSAEE